MQKNMGQRKPVSWHTLHSGNSNCDLTEMVLKQRRPCQIFMMERNTSKMGRSIRRAIIS